jgi:hypothetical protein
MTAGLPSDGVAEFFKELAQLAAREGSGILGTGKNLVFNKMETDDFRQALFSVKMTFDRIEDFEFQLLFCSAFCENRIAQSIGIEAAIRILFNEKYNFLHDRAPKFCEEYALYYPNFQNLFSEVYHPEIRVAGIVRERIILDTYHQIKNRCFQFSLKFNRVARKYPC